MEKKKDKKIILIVGLVAILLITLGVTYAFFTFARTGENQELVAGEIYMHYTEGEKVIQLEDAFPSMTYDENSYFEFTIDGKNTYENKDIWYEIILNESEAPDGRTIPIDPKYLRFTLFENGEKVLDGESYESLKDQRIWVNTINKNTKEEVNITYKLYMWISDELLIGEGGYDQDTWNNDVYASVRVDVKGDFTEKKLPYGYEKIKAKLNINNSITDDDDVIYLSGTNTDVNFNYVWYSGKLWRIVAIYPDGRMKMVTDELITSLFWNENTTYDGSYTETWLNEDFLNTLNNYQEIIDVNAEWDITETNELTKPVEPKMIEKAVGLLTPYEYYQSFKRLGADNDVNAYGNGYLGIRYTWWLITPYSDSNVWLIGDTGRFTNSLLNCGRGIRPSVILNANIELTGPGSKTNPYKISLDKKAGAIDELINTRTSGEYVKINDELYRIVGVEDQKTKLTKIDYLRDVNGVMKKSFSASATYGSGDSDYYWDYYLNNTWVKTIPNYEEILDRGTYYLGMVGPETSNNYKASICDYSIEGNLEKTTVDCEKTKEQYEGYVGLPRLGEMFATQIAEGGSKNSYYMWTLTPYDLQKVRFIDSNSYYNDPLSYNNNTIVVRPSISLKPEIVIKSGDGTKKNPYEVGLPS